MGGNSAGASGARFSDAIQERLGFYVYMLSDPRDGRPFYVGKGKGNRIFAHADAALDEGLVNAKLERIREIKRAGLKVDYELLRFGMTEATAFDVEATVMQLLHGSWGIELDNLAAGHHVALRGRMTTELAISLFDAPQMPGLNASTLILKIPQLWHPAMPQEDLYEATRGWWRIGPRREAVQYVMSVSKGVVRQVYRVSPGSWRTRRPGDRDAHLDVPGRERWGFEGEIATDMAAYRNTSVKELFKPGDRNVYKFINC